MKGKITDRFSTLIGEGQTLLSAIPPLVIPTDGHGTMKRIPGEVACSVNALRIPEYQQWLSSVSNLIHNVAGPDSYFCKECDRLMTGEGAKHSISSLVVQKMFGLLNAAKQEWDHGLLAGIEYIIAGTTFDNFLDHAAKYHRENNKNEASVLASAVLEDTVKKIAQKNGIETSGKTLDPLVDELVKANVFTPVKGKRVKAYAGVRNHALHADWDKFDISDVGQLIEGTRQLIENYL